MTEVTTYELLEAIAENGNCPLADVRQTLLYEQKPLRTLEIDSLNMLDIEFILRNKFGFTPAAGRDLEDYTLDEIVRGKSPR